MLRRRQLVVAATLAASAALAVGAGCFQEIDSGAASGGPITLASDAGGGGANAHPAEASAPGASEAGTLGSVSDDASGMSTWELCGSPACDLPSGEVPYLDQTPPIYLPDASTTMDPCAEVQQASMDIRTLYCASCHQAPADQAGINFVLDDAKLVTSFSQSATDDAGKPEKLVTPGDPAHSWLYVRIAEGIGGAQAGMPPPTMPGYPTIPRPTSSDLSVLFAWITACVPGADESGYAMGGGGYGPTSSSSDGGGLGAPGLGDAGSLDAGRD